MVHHRTSVALCLSYAIVSTLLCYPNQLNYFNEAAGGAREGRFHLLVGSIDSGQDLNELDRLLQKHPEWGPVASLCPECSISVQRSLRSIPLTYQLLNDISSTGYSHIAVSENVLAGEMDSPDDNNPNFGRARAIVRFLRNCKPTAFAGYSIHIFPVDVLISFVDHDGGPINASSPATDSIDGFDAIIESMPTLRDVSAKPDLSISSLVHVLLLNGYGETGLVQPSTGAEALRLLVDERFSKGVTGKSPFVRTRSGLRFLLDGYGDLTDLQGVGETHRDQCLAVFSSLRLPPDYPITLESERLSIRSLLSESIANFEMTQREMAWTAVAYSHYLPPDNSWVNRHGVVTTFSQLLMHMIDGGYRNQSCGGMHVLQAIQAIVEADYRNGVLDVDSRFRGRKFLSKSIEDAVQSQYPDGSWDLNWYEAAEPLPESIEAPTESQFVVTGHMLELMLQLRDRPPAPVIANATRWLCRSLRALKGATSPRVMLSACPLTHGLRAIKLAYQYRLMSTSELAEVFATH